jgi:FKBP-type peptidyl-prolyl cis-trans isomerase
VAEADQRLYATGPIQFFPAPSKQEFFMHAKSIAVAMLLVFGAAAPLAITPALAAEASQPNQLKIIDVKVGTGAVAKAGQQVTVHYTGWLYVNGAKGKKFDSSVDRGTPFSFALGAGNVIPGWDKGVAGMKVGGKRTLIIPPDMGYGAGGTPDGTIPPNATLIFDVELLKVG